MKYFYVLTILIISQILLNNSANAGPISDLVSWAKNSGTLNNNLITAYVFYIYII